MLNFFRSKQAENKDVNKEAKEALEEIVENLDSDYEASEGEMSDTEMELEYAQGNIHHSEFQALQRDAAKELQSTLPKGYTFK